MKFSWQRLPKPVMVLAPMEDVTDSVFRRIVGSVAPPDVYFTEFTSINGLFSRGREEVVKRFDYTETERPIIAQVWGTDPELFYKAAELIVERKFDGMDINMGCPEKNVTSRGAGACLVDDHRRVGEIISAAKEGLRGSIPLSVKTRLGYKKLAPDWIPFLFEQKLDALTIHARTASELSKVPAHWDILGEYAKLPRGETVMIGNGDVQNYRDAVEKCKTYGVDGVMIGRGIFSDLWAFDKRGQSHMDDRTELIRMLREHMRLFEQTGKHFAIMKKFFKIYIERFPHASALRERLMKATERKGIERELGLFVRAEIPERERREASSGISTKILSLSEWKNAKKVCVYRSLLTEVDTKELWKDTSKTIVAPEESTDADLYIVPGVSFDRNGWRLGRGGGFYDRLLAGSSSVKIGIAFEKQMVAEVPHFSYDVPMDMVITERGRYGKTKTS